MNCRKILLCCVLAATGSTGSLSAQQPESRLLPAAVGGVTGVAAGGYIAISLIVAEARMGRYIHDSSDILGWRSLPVVSGAIIGTTLGALSPRRLESAILFGAFGLGAGTALGLGIGSLVWDPPEGRWAGAAIGAGVGLVAGNIFGMLTPLRETDEPGIFFSAYAAGRPSRAAPGRAVPLIVQVRF
jgi:hypothetical protein